MTVTSSCSEDPRVLFLSGLFDEWGSEFEERVCTELAVNYEAPVAGLDHNSCSEATSCPAHLEALRIDQTRRPRQLLDIKTTKEHGLEKITPEGHPDKSGSSSRPRAPWTRQCKHLGDFKYLGGSIECHSKAIEIDPDSHPGKLGFLSNRGISQHNRFERLGEVSDLDRAIEYRFQLVQLTPDGHAEKPVRLDGLGNSWLCRFERLGALGDLDLAIDCQSQAVGLTLDGHLDKPARLNNLGHSCLYRFERLGELGDLDLAIDCQSQAVVLTPDGHPDKPARLNNLGNSWLCRFEHLGELAGIDHAIGCLSQAVVLTPDGHPDKPAFLNNLGNSWLCRFERLGELDDLDHAIDCQSQAVRLTPEGHPDKPAFLNNLGHSWLCRFERLGAPGDLDLAIDCQSRALELTPDDHPDRPPHLNSLGISWKRRFERLGELADIDRAIDCQSRAAELTPDGHPDKPARLNNLGNSWLCRFERLGEFGDLDRAINCQSRAVELTPECHHDKSPYLNSLGISWKRRFERLGELADIDRAIDCQSRAAELTPDGHPDKPARLNNLGNSWLCRFERLGEFGDLDRAINCQSRAVELTPDGHPDHPCYLNDLGASWMQHFQHMGGLSGLKKACDAFRTGTHTAAFKPGLQMLCADNWAKTLKLLNCSPLEAYQAAFSSLPRIVWIRKTIEQRHKNLNRVNDLSTEAAAWAISTHHYDLALEWLEQGRSVVWAQALQLRDEFKDLLSAEPELAHKLYNIAFQLDTVGSIPTSKTPILEPIMSPLSRAQCHHQLARDWDALVARARTLPGFESFLLPLKSSELKRAATDGPIVIVNTHQTRWDALAILPQQEEIIHVPLTQFSQVKLGQLNEQIPLLMAQEGNPRNTQGSTCSTSEGIAKLPALLWSHIVKPVLGALSYLGNTEPDTLPHVTWCTTGSLSFLPLHAAGLYDGISPNTPDLVFSSYTPMLNTLLFHKTSSHHAGLLAVGPDSLPGQVNPASAFEGLKSLRKYSDIVECSYLEGNSATVSATLAGLAEHSWVHFACHSTWNYFNPSQSVFYLRDGALSLEEIARHQFQYKGLAFLSACQTAISSHYILDEATHMASGMLMAGYPSVVATWSSVAEDLSLVADTVYSELLEDGKMDHTQSGRALHKAVKVLREKVGDKQIWRWAPFVHIGV
ncbi:CHAT domain protein [Ceratobasidium sp. AG-Ba]|nr:CHAT domain protein [Ceratobasidium sp. AG-Ba]